MRRTFNFGTYPCTVSLRGREHLYDDLEGSTFCIADANTTPYLPAGSPHLTVPTGEAAKSWLELERILSGMLAADLTRESLVVAVGGGVISDVSALAASLYMRGCGLVIVPTTLLAMVDAAIGGKTGINFGGYKNMVGTFFPAREVRICTQVLSTLPESEYLSGLAEVIKTALLGDEKLLRVLETEQPRVMERDESVLSEMVWACVQVKGQIVETDLRETGVRAHLNLGHTFAHALEFVQGLGTWSHGESVAWGLARAMELGVAAGITSPTYAARVRSVLQQYGYRIDPIPEAAEAIRNAMKKDKKRRGDEIRFVLQSELGETLVTNVETALVDATLGGLQSAGGSRR